MTGRLGDPALPKPNIIGDYGRSSITSICNFGDDSREDQAKQEPPPRRLYSAKISSGGRRMRFSGWLLHFCKRRFPLPSINDKCVIVAVQRPWTGRDILEFHKLPIGDICIAKHEIVADRRGNIESGTSVQIGSWPVIAEYVLPMVAAKRTYIFPLAIADANTFSDGDPASLQNGLP